MKRGKEKVVLGTKEEEEEEREEGIKYEWGREKGEFFWGRYRGGARV